MAILRIKDADGNVTEVLALRGEKGEPGKNGVLSVNGVTPDENGNIDITIGDTVTDEHINALIDTKLGVIENGTY